MDIWRIVCKLFGNYTKYSDSICTLLVQYSDGNFLSFIISTVFVAVVVVVVVGAGVN